MPTTAPPWPTSFLAPSEVLTWLNRQRPTDETGKRALLAIRWLVFAELERSAPDPPPRSITHFTPDEPAQSL